MRLVVVVNDPARLEPDQSTTQLALQAAHRGWDVRVAGVGNLAMLPDDRIVAFARPVDTEVADCEALCAGLARPSDQVDLSHVDVVLVRTNPARTGESLGAHETALLLLAIVVDRGGVVLNDPVGLLRASSKLYLAALPAEHRPETLVTRDRKALTEFVRSRGRCVLKPLKGTRGQDVFFVDGTDPQNLAQIVDVLVRDGVAMAQVFVPEAPDGDTRLLLLRGEPLEVDGKIAAVRRRPGVGELRSNVAQGGAAESATDLERVLAVGRAIGPRMRADGMFLVGLDVIGDRAVEVNVFSPGGFADAGRFSGVDFIPKVLDALVEVSAARRAK